MRDRSNSCSISISSEPLHRYQKLVVDGALLGVRAALENRVVLYLHQEFLEVVPSDADFLLEPLLIELEKKPVQAVWSSGYALSRLQVAIALNLHVEHPEVIIIVEKLIYVRGRPVLRGRTYELLFDVFDYLLAL